MATSAAEDTGAQARASASQLAALLLISVLACCVLISVESGALQCFASADSVAYSHSLPVLRRSLDLVAQRAGCRGPVDVAPPVSEFETMRRRASTLQCLQFSYSFLPLAQLRVSRRVRLGRLPPLPRHLFLRLKLWMMLAGHQSIWLRTCVEQKISFDQICANTPSAPATVARRAALCLLCFADCFLLLIHVAVVHQKRGTHPKRSGGKLLPTSEEDSDQVVRFFVYAFQGPTVLLRLAIDEFGHG